MPYYCTFFRIFAGNFRKLPWKITYHSQSSYNKVKPLKQYISGSRFIRIFVSKAGLSSMDGRKFYLNG